MTGCRKGMRGPEETEVHKEEVHRGDKHKKGIGSTG